MFSIIRPALFSLDAERAHQISITALSQWAAFGAPLGANNDAPALHMRIAGIAFPNPIGLAAGADKDGRAIDGFFALGFGCVEIGTLTPVPQAGNPKPRLFRLTEDKAVINRLGFNNGGLAAALPRAAARKRAGILGINVGANKDTTNRIGDYRRSVRAAAPVADYVTINISSPNTPGLRDLQHGAALAELLAAASEARILPRRKTPLFLKIAPDLDYSAVDNIARSAIENGIDALIISNTTISRPQGLHSQNSAQAGGLSGAPLAALARARLADARRATGGMLPLISAGGIGSGAEAYARIRAGASLVQLYSALVFEGPGLARRIATDMERLMRADGHTHLAQAIGTD